MKTIIATGPGFYAADSDKMPSVPKGKLRVYCARIEVYELDETQGDLDTSFELLVAKAEKQPGLANALLKLADSLEANRQELSNLASQ